ncbi:hypothetical protein IKG12_01275 [Candidatus Saccharibacteria bacterium]|nr:hypothetical protein [Candidatus Saccharibacteria bacterium]
MTRKHRIDYRRIYMLTFIFSMAATMSALLYASLPAVNAIHSAYSGFNAGDIISDEVMSDYGSMSEAEIQNFLKSKNPCNDTNIVKASWYPRMSYHIENGHFVCMADENFDGQSAAHIIWQAAQDYRINPRVLIVLLEKEQGLVTDTWPNSTLQYRSATGYGCPDTAACDSQYYGFRNQVRNAAELYRYILDNGSKYYPTGQNYIQYNPNSGCGGSVVNIVNRATSALYQYTPYQPNDGVLNTAPGVTATCGAYGNANFYYYYTSWFGSTHTVSSSQMIVNRMTEVYDNVGGADVFGLATSGVEHNDTTGIYWKNYQNGVIVGNDQYGYYESRGGIRNTWAEQGFESGVLSFPLSNIMHNDTTDIYWQNYLTGVIVGNDKYGYYESRGQIRNVWHDQGFESGELGFPISNIASNYITGIYWQNYTGGVIVGNDQYGYYESRGGIRNAWAEQGFEGGSFGFPTSNIMKNDDTGIYWQNYTGGVIVGNDQYGYYESRGGIRNAWAEQGFEGGKLGFPTSNIQHNYSTNITWQIYQNGLIVGNDQYGYYESRGKIRDVWADSGFENGRFGFPTSNIYTNGNIQYQVYQNGVIYYNTATGEVSTH